jgi:hypothetical protein
MARPLYQWYKASYRVSNNLVQVLYYTYVMKSEEGGSSPIPISALIDGSVFGIF